MDLLEKCREFHAGPERAQAMGYPSNPRTLEALGLYPYFLPVERREGPEVVVRGRRLVMLGSNDYLGLTADPRVREAAMEAVRIHGPACTGSRFLNGTLELHLELEARLAAFLGKEKALVMSTGYQVNLGTIGALIGPDDLVVADREVHASIIDGIRLAQAARKGQCRFFRHHDLEELDGILTEAGEDTGTLVVVDGVYSMGGDLAPLPGIVAACRRHRARLMVDDAHGIGVLGGGRGTTFHFGSAPEVDLIMGTFSKALASTGGFIAGSTAAVHWIQHFARPFIFSASLSPSQAAAALAALGVLEREPELPARALENAEIWRQGLREAGFETGESASAIVPVVIGDQFRTVQAWKELLEAGVYVNVALPPSVPQDASLLRTSVMATHTRAQLERALEGFRAVRRKLGSGLTDRVREPDRGRAPAAGPK